MENKKKENQMLLFFIFTSKYPLIFVSNGRHVEIQIKAYRAIRKGNIPVPSSLDGNGVHKHHNPPPSPRSIFHGAITSHVTLTFATMYR